jgi:oxalate decarboxylase
MIVSRRAFAAVTASGILTASAARAAQVGNSDNPPQGSAAIKNNPRSSNVPGPQNKVLDAQFPSSDMPPSTDHGDVENFWFPLAQANRRIQSGGWTRQVTVKELPIATTLAGVDMRLTAGGVRELHWHLPAEWAFVLYDNARITAFDQDGRSYVADVSAADLWNFPSGIPHSIQGLEPDGTEFLLVFDDGSFSEFSTFLPSVWMVHTPVEVLAKNFGVSGSAFDPIPLHELYIFQAPVPASLTQDQQAAPRHNLSATRCSSRSRISVRRRARFGSSIPRTFPYRRRSRPRMSSLRPGAMREMHWHPNADEWQYYIAGSGRMGVFAAGGQRPDQGFSRWRRRLHPVFDGTLRREYRRQRTWSFSKCAAAVIIRRSPSRSGSAICRRNSSRLTSISRTRR